MKSRLCVLAGFALMLVRIHSVQGQPASVAVQHELSLEEIEQLIERDPKSAENMLRDRINRGEIVNGLVPMYLGLAILKQEPEWPSRNVSPNRFREVVTYSTQALELNPALVVALVTRGIARARLGILDDAEQDFWEALEQVEGFNGFEKVKSTAGEWLHRVKPWSVSMRIGGYYDSNVTQVGRNVAIPSSFGRKHDSAFESGAAVSYRLLSNHDIDWATDVRMSGLWNSNVHEVDEQAYGLNMGLRFKGESADVGVDYDYSFLRLGRDDYLSRHEVRPYVAIHPLQGHETELYYDFQDRRYYDVPNFGTAGPFDRSGEVHSVGVSHSLVLLPTKYGDLVAQLGYRHENISTRGTEYDAENEVLTCSVRVPLPWSMEVGGFGTWSWEDYKGRSVLDSRGRGRRDFVQSYGVTLTKSLCKNMAIQGILVATDDDSNIFTRRREAVYSYDRIQAGVALLIQF